MAKKKPTKSNLRKIIYLSTGIIVFIILAVYVTYRSLLTPIQIAEISSDSIARPCNEVAFQDNFSKSTLNNQKWIYYDKDIGGSGTIIDGKLILTLPAGKDNSHGSISSTNLIAISGDFIQTITLESIETNNDSKAASFFLGTFTLDWRDYYRVEIYKNGDIQTYSTDNKITTSSTPIKAYTDQPAKLKMVRSGSTLTTYYDIGNGYQLHSTVPNITTKDLFIQLGSLSHAPDKPKVTIALDNYSLSCPSTLSPSSIPTHTPPSPKTTLRHTNSTQTTLSFSWDKVNNAPSYIIDLADNPNFDSHLSSGIIGADNNQYTFGGLVSNHTYYTRLSLANIHDFPRYTTLSNIKTSSPPHTTITSIKPTTRPTIRPTIQPNPAFTPTPKPTINSQISYRTSSLPSAYPLSTLAPNNIYTETTQPSPNFITRLITWLQSIFD